MADNPNFRTYFQRKYEEAIKEAELEDDIVYDLWNGIIKNKRTGKEYL